MMAALVDGAERRFAAPFGVLTVACVPGPIAVGTGAAEGGGDADGAAAAAVIRSAMTQPLYPSPVTGHQLRPSALWPSPLIVSTVPLLIVRTTAAAVEGCSRTAAFPVGELMITCAPGTKPEGRTVAGGGEDEAVGDGAALGAAVGLGVLELGAPGPGAVDDEGLALGAAEGVAGAGEPLGLTLGAGAALGAAEGAVDGVAAADGAGAGATVGGTAVGLGAGAGVGAGCAVAAGVGVAAASPAGVVRAGGVAGVAAGEAPGVRVAAATSGALSVNPPCGTTPESRPRTVIVQSPA